VTLTIADVRASTKGKGRLRCHKRPKSRRKRPRRAAIAGWGWGGRYRIPLANTIAISGGSRVRCFTRNGHDWADRFPTIVDAAHRIKAQSFLIDGEAVIARDDERCGSYFHVN
jgi:hypothetical protein